MRGSREFYIANDVVDPTPYEERERDDDEIAICPICGRPIYRGDCDITVIEDMEDRPMHTNCTLFSKKSLDWFCEVLKIDLYPVTGKELSK